MPDLNLQDTMPFGKHKGQTVEAVYKEDAAYLVWLRQTRKDQNADTKFFSQEVSTLLDMTIRESKQLQKTYKPWDLEPMIQVVTEAKPQERQPEVSYGGAWGNF